MEVIAFHPLHNRKVLFIHHQLTEDVGQCEDKGAEDIWSGFCHLFLFEYLLTA